MTNPWATKIKSDRNFYFGVIFLVLVGVFVPERYSILVFLGFIWAILFEISDRLRTHYYFHQRTAESIENLSKRWVKNDDV